MAIPDIFVLLFYYPVDILFWIILDTNPFIIGSLNVFQDHIIIKEYDRIIVNEREGKCYG